MGEMVVAPGILMAGKSSKQTDAQMLMNGAVILPMADKAGGCRVTMNIMQE